MADSQDTRTAPFSRRAVMAGLAAAPVAGLPAIAGAAMNASLLAVAIERFKIATAAVKAHSGPEDIPEELMLEESAALYELAVAPCANDAELVQKLRVLLEFERGCVCGGEFDISSEGSLPIALEAYFAQGARS